MYQFSPMTDRIKARRERYRNDKPSIDIARYKLVTEFYMQHPELSGTLRRAYNFKNLCENLPLHLEDDDLLAGVYVDKYHASALYPENSIKWLIPELEQDIIQTRTYDPYLISEEDKRYILSTADYWLGESMSCKLNPYIPQEYRDIAMNGCYVAPAQDQATMPVGHFCANHNKAVREGYKKTRDEAQAKCTEMLEKGIEGDDAAKYDFYKSVVIVCDGVIAFAKRYSKLLAEKAAQCGDAERKRELEKMSSAMGWVMENGARDYWEALQAVWFNEMCVVMDANLHGTSIGRLDMYVGDYLERDLASGAITREKAQELMDMFYLKEAEINKAGHQHIGMAAPGYTSGQAITLGGVDAKGNDATNEATYMALESAARLVLHDPPTCLRCHPNMPDRLWDCAIETNKRAGGVPSYYSDPVQIAALTKSGHSQEDANNYCLIGCVEPSGCGNDWAASGGNGAEAFMNTVNALTMALNNGTNPMPNPDGSAKPQTGPSTGYLYEMSSMDEVLAAVKEQVNYWVKWNVTMINLFEERAAEFLPQPFVSALMDGCMESGKDVMRGGAKYNGCGLTAVGLGNIVDSLNIIDTVCFKTKKFSTRELYDAVMANWEGHEDMKEYIRTHVVHYGNGDPEADKYATWFGNIWADAVTSRKGPRGPYKAGTWPVTMNVLYGFSTYATPDGRTAGMPLADGISAVQQLDTNGPIAELRSCSVLPQTRMENGTLLNMKFHPSALAADSGKKKLVDLMRTYFFDLEGGQMQINIVSADTMRAAQKEPEKYKDLVVRIAGFSAYFVDVYKQAQDDLIRRTEQQI